MRVNQTVVALAFAKRDADIDAEYEEAMEEIEDMKKKCKALEYGTHATGLVTNLLGDIPDIPLVTDTIKKVTSGISAVAHVAEFGMNIASTAMECDDWNFEEIKAIMEKRFTEMDRKLDKMTQAMGEITDMVTKALDSVESTRREMNWGFKNVLATLKNREIQSILSKINKFSRYFEEKSDELLRLPAHQFVFRLKEKEGILDYLKKVRMPEGLHSDLFELMDKNNNFAIPEDSDDTKAFQALYALFYGTQTYAAVTFFLLKQHSYLADYYYQKGQDKEFNDEFDLLITTFNEFKTSLTGNNGLINKVVQTLDEVKNKDFIKDVKNELYADISKRMDTLKMLKSNITGMVLNVIEDTPESVVNMHFLEPLVPSNYGDWDDKSKVRYAVQLMKDGAYSKFSEWTEPLKVEGKANPTLTVPRDEKGRQRLVFRKFNDAKPQLAGILTKSQVEFRDIDRDLYDAARSKDQSKALEYIPKLMDANAYINAVFETKRSVMHAAAESGNVQIAMRFLLDETQDELLNAKDDKGFTPMHVAAGTKNAGFVNFLITHHADVNAQTTVDRLTPLHIAAKKGYLISVRNLLGADKIEINKPEKSGYTPLHYAVRGTIKTIKELLANDKITVNAKSYFGLTPFHLAVMKGDREICHALLSSGKVEVNAGNINNLTALHFAAMEGNVDMIQYLISGGKGVEEVDINAVTSDNNWTPLYFAIYFKQEDAALELLKNGKTDVSISSKENVTPLQLSVATGQMKVFDELLKKDSNLEAVSKDGLTALHVAALRPDTTFTAKLLDRNVNIDAKAEDGSTPLHLASKYDKKTQIVFLISRGANMKLYDKNGFLPLQYSIKNINLEATRAAVSKDPSIVDTNTTEGETVMKYCLDFVLAKAYDYHKNKDSVEYLKYKGMQPLEIFNKKGYYDLIRIVQNDPSKENLVSGIMQFMENMSVECIRRESNGSEKQCVFIDIRTRRATDGNFEDNRNLPLAPLLPPMVNSIKTVNVGNLNNLGPKQVEKINSFSHAKSSALQNVDTIGMLLLIDLLVRKFKNEKYKVNVQAPMSTLGSQVAALKIVEKFTTFVDDMGNIPAEELIDLAKLHSDIYKAIEAEKSNNIIDLLCDQLKDIVDPGQVEAFLASLMTSTSDSENQNFILTVKQQCLPEANKNHI